MRARRRDDGSDTHGRPAANRLAPMKAVSGELPTGEGWAFEIKWDGMRVLASVDPGADPPVALQSATLKDVTARYPELSGLAAGVGTSAVLDCEVVALGDDGRPSFGLLQQRMHLVDPDDIARRAAEIPVQAMIFDLLAVADNDATSLAYRERRRLLEELIEPHERWRVAPSSTDGPALFAAAKAQGLEGLIAKRVDSPYQPGRRSPAWRKVKIRRRQELVVGGWAEGVGGGLGALLVGYQRKGADGLVFAGRVGTGFKDAERARLQTRLEGLARAESPFDADSVPGQGGRASGARPAPAGDPHYVDPEVVVEVAFGEWTPEGRLRHPSYLGERVDRDPETVVREPS